MLLNADVLLCCEAFDRVGRFDEERRLAEDVDWIMRAQEAGAPIVRVDDVVYDYRQRAGSLTRDLDAGNATLVKALRDSIVRRREQAPWSLSAIVAVRDGERYVGAALASLIAQTRPPDEIVVVDDGSNRTARPRSPPAFPA